MASVAPRAWHRRSQAISAVRTARRAARPAARSAPARRRRRGRASRRRCIGHDAHAVADAERIGVPRHHASAAAATCAGPPSTIDAPVARRRNRTGRTSPYTSDAVVSGIARIATAPAARGGSPARCRAPCRPRGGTGRPKISWRIRPVNCRFGWCGATAAPNLASSPISHAQEPRHANPDRSAPRSRVTRRARALRRADAVGGRRPRPPVAAVPGWRVARARVLRRVLLRLVLPAAAVGGAPGALAALRPHGARPWGGLPRWARRVPGARNMRWHRTMHGSDSAVAHLPPDAPQRRAARHVQGVLVQPARHDRLDGRRSACA